MIDGATVDGVREVSGIETEIEVIEYQDGGDLVTRKRPGRVKYGDINVKRVVMKADTLSEWFEKTRGGTTERKSGSVIYLDRAGAEVLRYNFFEAWPCRWSGPEPDADPNEPLPVEDIAPATAAHIHKAPAGAPGPVVVGLTAPTGGSSSGCVNLDREKILEILSEPAAYYVNVHNADHPAGAVRGQLSRH